MKILDIYGKEELATVWIAQLADGRLIEFAESVQPPIPREKKWVLLISVLAGCPVRCRICDAGGHYQGSLSAEEILAQIDFLIKRRYPDRKVPVPKFKIQFARMGEPTFNDAVLEVLEKLPERYDAPGLMPCLSTIAPDVCDKFFTELKNIKDKMYRGRFQLQFSIHTTDEKLRDYLMPIKKWDFDRIADYGRRFYRPGDRKIGLNFATPIGFPIEANVIEDYFSPEIFLLKFTPLNPTYQAIKNNLKTYIDPADVHKNYEELVKLKTLGYDVLISIGENEENLIGSNCGQFITNYLKSKITIENSYYLKNYKIYEFQETRSE